MIDWQLDLTIYLHRDAVDFRKAINGLSVIVQNQMDLSPFDRALFVFCNKQQNQLKVLYWDSTGFALWQKRLEKSRFKWPKKHTKSTFQLSHEQWLWLLRGIDINKIKPLKTLSYAAIS